MKGIIFLIFIFALSQTFGQCVVTGSVASGNAVPCNGCVTLSATGMGGNTSVFVETFNSGQPVGWQFTQTITIAANTCGVPSPDGSPFMWMGSTSPAPRTMATIGLDVSSGGNVCFEMRYAIQQDNAPCEGPDLSDEGVTLQYSINGGSTWVTMNYWPPLNGGYASSMTVWNQYCENIPIAAQTTSTMFRWTQMEATNSAYDHWGLDNVGISLTSPDFNMTWLHDNYSYGIGNNSGDNPTPVCPEGDTIFVIEMTDGTTFCYDTVEITIDYPQIDDVTITDPYCGGINGEIDILASGGSTNYQYSIDNGQNFYPSSTFMNLDSLTYMVILLDANNCSDTTIVTLVGVDSLFLIDLLSENTSCGMDNGSISFNGIGGTPNYQYSINNGSSYSNTSTFDNVSSNTYNLVVLDDLGCTATASVDILPSSAPIIDSIQVSEDYCSLSNGTLASFVSSGTEPFEYLVTQGVDTIGTNNNGAFSNLTFGNYDLMVLDIANCYSTVNFSINEIPAPVVVLQDTALCDLSFQIQNVSSNTGSLWTANSANITFDDETALNPGFQSTEPGEYNISFEDTLCDFNESFDIIFIANPLTQINDTLLCIGENYNLQAEVQAQNEIYLWNSGENSSFISINQTGTYIVTVSNTCGSFTDSAYVLFYECDLEAPNVFTPNNDDINDYFQLINHQGIKTFQCSIYNRWGNLMGKYDDPDFIWKGTNLNDKIAPEGVYFYVIHAITNGGHEIDKQGKIHLIRND